MSTADSPDDALETAARDRPKLEITSSRQFTGWLAECGASIALSTYQSGKVLLIGSDPARGKLAVFERTLERPMGMAFDGKRLAIALQTQIVTFVDATEGQPMEDGHDALFVPQFAHFTADIDAHDLAFARDGSMVFANTLFSCLASPSLTHSFKPLWKPPFISRLAAEDRCHMNGLAMREGAPAFVTAVSQTDMADGWRDHRRGGGVVIDVAGNTVVCSGLSMPHSPRWHQGQLYVLNSGEGEFGRVNLDTGRFEPIAFCPGYLRGLSFIGPYALVGLSEPRENKTFSGLPLQERLSAAGVEARCGVYVIDTRSGDIAHWLRLSGVVRELYDVTGLPGIRRPKMIGFRQQEIRRVVSMEGSE
jgi:uncharacterized protein (TIGR03032 family)